MLATSMFRNLATDRQFNTIAGANAVGIAMGGEKAQRDWFRQQALSERPPDVPVDNPAVAAQAATIGRLRTLYNAQKPNSGLRNAIRAKKPD